MPERRACVESKNAHMTSYLRFFGPALWRSAQSSVSLRRLLVVVPLSLLLVLSLLYLTYGRAARPAAPAVRGAVRGGARQVRTSEPGRQGDRLTLEIVDDAVASTRVAPGARTLRASATPASCSRWSRRRAATRWCGAPSSTPPRPGVLAWGRRSTPGSAQSELQGRRSLRSRPIGPRRVHSERKLEARHGEPPAAPRFAAASGVGHVAPGEQAFACGALVE